MPHVYFLLREDGLVKIGCSGPLKWRMAAHRIKNRVRLIGVVAGGFDVEKEIHAAFSMYRIGKKHPDGRGTAKELFRFPPAVLAEIESGFAADLKKFLDAHGVDASFCRVGKAARPNNSARIG